MIEKLESSDRKPSSQIALLLADRLGVPADEHQAFLEFSKADLPPDQLDKLAQASGARGSPPTSSHAPWRTLHGISTNLPTPPHRLHRARRNSRSWRGGSA